MHQLLATTLIRSALFLLLLSSIPGSAQAQPYQLWGKLQSGPHDVGFRTTWQLDYTRTYKLASDASSGSPRAKAPRPILINIWYPARRSEHAEAMAYEEYLSILSSHPQLQGFSQKLIQHNREVMCKELLGKAENELNQRESLAWKEFHKTRTAAFREAEPAPGKFPVLIYHSGAGSSFEDNSVLCEYLASHGYVVIGSAFQDGDGSSLNTYGGRSSLQDIAFLIAYAQRMPQADWNRIGLGGHSAGAQAAMRFGARPQSVVDALLILDTTQDYHSLANPLWSFPKPVLENARNFTGSILAVAGPAAIFQLMDRLEWADRYYFTIDKVGHNEFISQGVIRSRLASQYGLMQDDRGEKNVPPSERERRAQDLSQRFKAICEYVLTFLDAHLKKQPQAIASLEKSHRDARPGAEPFAEHVPVGTSVAEAYSLASSEPPSPRQLRRFLAEHGLDSTLALLDRFWSKDAPAPIYDGIYGFAWVYELFEQGETAAAKALSKRYDQFIEGGLKPTFSIYCNLGHRVGHRDFARACFERFLVIAPENADARQKLASLQDSNQK